MLACTCIHPLENYPKLAVPKVVRLEMGKKSFEYLKLGWIYSEASVFISEGMQPRELIPGLHFEQVGEVHGNRTLNLNLEMASSKRCLPLAVVLHQNRIPAKFRLTPE